MNRLIETVLIGIGATLCIDLWAIVLRRGFGIRSLDYCMLGRWLLHMPAGRFVHDGIAKAAAKAHECTLGWVAHYSIGIAFAVLFLLIAPTEWLQHPTILPALAFGIATVAVPFFTMQPAFGLGFAASRSPNPAAARLKSLATHTIFGAGLFVTAWTLR